MKWTEIKQMSDSALQAELDKSTEELRNLRFQSAVGPLENPMVVRLTRRKIARIETILNERRRSAASSGKAGK